MKSGTWTARSGADGRSARGEILVYLMLNERNGYIKIGTSRRPQYREMTLQAEEPEVILLATAPGGRRFEADLHRRFAAERVRGEWFRIGGYHLWLLLMLGLRAVDGAEARIDQILGYPHLTRRRSGLEALIGTA